MSLNTITFLTDYGTADEFVGVCHSVIRAISPSTAVVDLSHEIDPHDVRAGALMLARSVPYLCPGVVVAVVDPGVGTDRRAVAVEVGGGQSILVGPDNGLLAPAVHLCDGATRVHQITNPEFLLDGHGQTFDGRDVFCPAAAHLCEGVDISELGPALDPALLRPGLLPITREEDEWLIAEVLWVDRFGNAQLNVDEAQIQAWGDHVSLKIQGLRRTARRVRGFAELVTNEIGILQDSYGLMALVVDRGSAAELLDLQATSEVQLSEATDIRSGGGQVTDVELGRRR